MRACVPIISTLCACVGVGVLYCAPCAACVRDAKEMIYENADEIVYCDAREGPSLPPPPSVVRPVEPVILNSYYIMTV